MAVTAEDSKKRKFGVKKVYGGHWKIPIKPRPVQRFHLCVDLQILALIRKINWHDLYRALPFRRRGNRAMTLKTQVKVCRVSPWQMEDNGNRNLYPNGYRQEGIGALSLMHLHQFNGDGSIAKDASTGYISWQKSSR